MTRFLQRLLRLRAPRPALAAASLLLLSWGCDSGPVAPPVVVPPLSSISVIPARDTIGFGQSITLTLTALDTLGNVVPGVPATWTSTDASVVTVSGVGKVEAVSEGTARIIATVTDQRDSVFKDTTVIVVVPPTGWYQQVSGTSQNLNGVYFHSSGRTGWVVGDGGVVLKTQNAGTSWVLQVPYLAELNSVWVTPRNGWIVGAQGTLLRSDGAGNSWTRMTNVGTNLDLHDVMFANSDTGWVVGAAGTIFGTVNGGNSWVRQFAPTVLALRSVHFANTRRGWAVGDNGVIVGTNDGGASWYLVQPSVTVNDLRGVWRSTRAQAIAVGAAGATLRTTSFSPDSAAWEYHNAGALYILEGVSNPLAALMTGYAVGTTGGVGLVLRTDDGGTTWTRQDIAAGAPLHEVFFVDAARGWAVGAQGRIYHTASGGLEVFGNP